MNPPVSEQKIKDTLESNTRGRGTPNLHRRNHMLFPLYSLGDSLTIGVEIQEMILQEPPPPQRSKPFRIPVVANIVCAGIPHNHQPNCTSSYLRHRENVCCTSLACSGVQIQLFKLEGNIVSLVSSQGGQGTKSWELHDTGGVGGCGWWRQTHS